MNKQFAIKKSQALKFIDQLVAKQESTNILEMAKKPKKCYGEIEFLGLAQKPVFSL